MEFNEQKAILGFAEILKILDNTETHFIFTIFMNQFVKARLSCQKIILFYIDWSKRRCLYPGLCHFSTVTMSSALAGLGRIWNRYLLTMLTWNRRDLTPLSAAPRQRFTWSKTWCDIQQLWKAVITGDTVTRLSIPIRVCGESPEEGQKWNLVET